MGKYIPQYYDLLRRVRVHPSALPPKLKSLVEKFESAVEATKEKDQFIWILAQVDAVISANIARFFKIQLEKGNSNTQPDETVIEKAKAMVMKARELQRKWGME
jgi:hypothetical protein